MHQPSFYLIYGDDSFRVNLELKALQTSVGGDEQFATELSPKDDLSSTLCGLSLFTKSKLIRINLAEFETELLFKFFSQEEIPAEHRVIFYQAGKLDKRLKLFKFLNKEAKKVLEINEFSPWKPTDTISWLASYASQTGIKAQKLALQKLVELYGNQTAFLVSELEKLFCYSAETEITLAHVEELCQAQNNLFDLVDLALSGQYHKLSSELSKLLLFQPPLQLLVGLQTIMRGYLNIKSLHQSGYNPSEIAKLISKHPWKVSQDLQKIQSLSFNYLLSITKTINQIEEDCKTGLFFDESLSFRFRFLSLAAKC